MSDCVYCGGAAPRSVACPGHSDLPRLDPFFTPEALQRQEPIEDFRPEALLDRLVTTGG